MDAHRGPVVSAEDTRRGVVKTGEVALERGEARKISQLSQDFHKSGLVIRVAFVLTLGWYQFLQALTMVVHADDGVVRHGGVVTAAIDLRQTAAVDFEVGLGKLRRCEAGPARGGHRRGNNFISQFIFNVMGGLACLWGIGFRVISIVTVAAAIDTTDENGVVESLFIIARRLVLHLARTDKGRPAIVDVVLLWVVS